MTFAAAQIAIEARFDTNFTACAKKFENVNYEPKPDVNFAELHVVEADNRRVDIGTNNPLHRTYGTISVNIYTAKHIGSNTGRTLADTAAAVFRDASFSGITCRSPLVRNVGEIEDWYVINMSCEFFRDEVHT
jgi:hypothetical protein